MTPSPAASFNPELDLRLERWIDVPANLVWAAWTRPEHLKQWFCPAPWSVSHCEIDLRPGGAFITTMRSPEGQEFPNAGCFLEVVPESRLVFTDALLPGYRPAESPFMTATVEIAPEGTGTRYVATALHNSAAARQKHAEMGFAEGWGKALDQLVALVKTLQAGGAK